MEYSAYKKLFNHKRKLILQRIVSEETSAVSYLRSHHPRCAEVEDEHVYSHSIWYLSAGDSYSCIGCCELIK